MRLMIEVPEGSPASVVRALQEVVNDLSLHVHEDEAKPPKGRMGFKRPAEVKPAFMGEDAEHVPEYLVARFNGDGE